jgi:hypothetical protein
MLFETGLNGQATPSKHGQSQLVYDTVHSIKMKKPMGLLDSVSTVSTKKEVPDPARRIQRSRIREALSNNDLPKLLTSQERKRVMGMDPTDRENYCIDQVYAIVMNELEKTRKYKFGGYVVDSIGFLVNATGAWATAGIGAVPAWLIETSIEHGITFNRRVKSLEQIDLALWYIDVINQTRADQGKEPVVIRMQKAAFDKFSKVAATSRHDSTHEFFEDLVARFLTWKTAVRTLQDNIPFYGIVHNPITQGEEDNLLMIIALNKIYDSYEKRFTLENPSAK